MLPSSQLPPSYGPRAFWDDKGKQHRLFVTTAPALAHLVPFPRLGPKHLASILTLQSHGSDPPWHTLGVTGLSQGQTDGELVSFSSGASCVFLGFICQRNTLAGLCHFLSLPVISCHFLPCYLTSRYILPLPVPGLNIFPEQLRREQGYSLNDKPFAYPPLYGEPLKPSKNTK